MPKPKVIDYYFAPMSGYAYLGHARFLGIAKRAGVEVRYHPLDMAQVFAAAGSFPPAKYPAIRQTHRKAGMARWASKLDIPFNETPAVWPVPMPLACAVITASKHLGIDEGAVTAAVLRAVWVHDFNISDQDDLREALKMSGLPADKLLAASTEAAVVAQSSETTKAAINIGIFGSPTYVFENEWFFGQDRLEFLASAL